MTADLFSSAFDDHRPPRLDLINDCVHCGFCLPTCPTYVLWGEEADSPRGRIYLMETGLAGEPMTDSMVQHFDRCLGRDRVPIRGPLRPAHRGHPGAGGAAAPA
jgi:Fe-S oxidoreductase